LLALALGVVADLETLLVKFNGFVSFLELLLQLLDL
jgi:hypothetical protein